jgi:arylsulfatase A-like enzyme
MTFVRLSPLANWHVRRHTFARTGDAKCRLKGLFDPALGGYDKRGAPSHGSVIADLDGQCLPLTVIPADGVDEMDRPNLLFLFGDEHRRQALGCYGNPDVRTPVLDGLAAQGVRFTHGYANMAVCTPCRGSMLTGCWPQRHLALGNDMPVDPQSPSIARALNGAGYACGYIGKWHLGGIPRDRFIPPGPERLGFDAFWAAWNCHHQYMQPKYHLDDPEPVILDGRYEPEVQTDLALQWLARQRAEAPDQPFCLFLSYGPPHNPYRPLPPGMEDAYDPASLTLRLNCADTPETRRDLADYYTHVTALDNQIGRLIDALRETGELAKTVIVYTSDHGTLLDSHGRKYKQWPYEESVGIPLLMAGPGIPAGQVNDLLIGVVDYAPTLLSLLGVPVPPEMQGYDLSPHIQKPDEAIPERPHAIYLQEASAGDQAIRQGMIPWRGLRTARYTYARSIDGPWMLFDNQADPYQLRNLVQDASTAQLREELDAALSDWMARLGDTLEPVDGFMARHGVGEVWQARQAYFRQGQQRTVASPESARRKA